MAAAKSELPDSDACSACWSGEGAPCAPAAGGGNAPGDLSTIFKAPAVASTGAGVAAPATVGGSFGADEDGMEAGASVGGSTCGPGDTADWVSELTSDLPTWTP